VKNPISIGEKPYFDRRKTLFDVVKNPIWVGEKVYFGR
jgi:hypothetical protein